MGWWSIAASALGSALSSRSSNRASERQSREQTAAMERMSRAEAAQRRAELEGARRYDLEDRRYREEAIGGFRQFARPGLSSPEYSSTDPSRIEVPAIEGDKKKRGLLG